MTDLRQPTPDTAPQRQGSDPAALAGSSHWLQTSAHGAPADAVIDEVLWLLARALVADVVQGDRDGHSPQRVRP